MFLFSLLFPCKNVIAEKVAPPKNSAAVLNDSSCYFLIIHCSHYFCKGGSLVKELFLKKRFMHSRLLTMLLACYRKFFLTIVVFAFAVLCVGCDTHPASSVIKGETMGTFYSIKIADAVEETAIEKLANKIEKTLININNQMSTYIEDSEISRFNLSRSTEWQAASSQLVTVLLKAQQLSEISAGGFDITIGPLVNLWGFGPGPDIDEVPTANAITRALSVVGFHHLEVRVSPPMIRKRIPQLYVDLSAIAKGYAVDKITEVLVTEGIRNSLVNIGGELYASGVNTRGELWHIGIEQPVDGVKTMLDSIQVSDASVATSGDYRIYIEIEGQRYSHEIDPYTGWPVAHHTVLVSVVASHAMEADALATALIVLGSERGIALADRHGIAAYFVDRAHDGFVSFQSSEFKTHFASALP